jgi:hypothetical protein
MDEKLIFSASSKIEFATNTFVNVPVILRYEDTDIISLQRQVPTEYHSKISIYHSDGTKLATAVNSRIFLEDGIKTDIKIDKYPNLWVCKMNGKEIFEIHQQPCDQFKLYAELFTNDGFFIKYSNYKCDVPIVRMSDLARCASCCEISNVDVGFWVKRNGQVIIGNKT